MAQLTASLVRFLERPIYRYDRRRRMAITLAVVALGAVFVPTALSMLVTVRAYPPPAPAPPPFATSRGPEPRDALSQWEMRAVDGLVTTELRPGWLTEPLVRLQGDPLRDAIERAKTYEGNRVGAERRLLELYPVTLSSPATVERSASVCESAALFLVLDDVGLMEGEPFLADHLGVQAILQAELAMVSSASADFHRLRFLVEARGPFAVLLRPLVDPMLTTFPNDPAVIRASMRVLGATGSDADLAMGEHLAKTLPPNTPIPLHAIAELSLYAPTPEVSEPKKEQVQRFLEAKERVRRSVPQRSRLSTNPDLAIQNVLVRPNRLPWRAESAPPNGRP